MDNASLVQQLKNHWEGQRINNKGSLSPEQIQAFETKFNVIIPVDFHQYLMELNGMANFETDNDLIRFYPLDEMTKCTFEDFRYQVLNDHFFIFADWSISAFIYAIELLPYASASNKVCLIGGEAPFLIGNSFTDFMRLYLSGNAMNY